MTLSTTIPPPELASPSSQYSSHLTTTSFNLFPALPAELRLKIWHLSFLPRTIELHTRKLHYADDDHHGDVPKWQSRCANPSALAVCAEARAAAHEHFTVSLPLATNRACERSGESSFDLHRKLYLSPEADTLVVLGELNLARLKSLLGWMRRSDPRGNGLRRLGLSAGCFAHAGGGRYMMVYSRTIFKDLDELVLFMYNERMPPEGWSDGVCELRDCRGKDHYRRFEMGRGAELKMGYSWMTVGKRELSVMDLDFVKDTK